MSSVTPESGVVETLTGHSGQVNALALVDVDGRPVVVGGDEDGTVRLWDAATGEPRATLTGHEGRVAAVAAAVVEGRPLVLSGSEDGTVRLWSAAEGSQRQVFGGITGVSWSVALDEAGGFLVIASSGEDGTARLWDLSIADQRAGLGVGFARVAVGTIGTQPVLASTGEATGAVYVWDPVSAERMFDLANDTDGGDYFDAAFGRLGDRDVLAAVTHAGAVQLWDLASRERLWSIAGHDGDATDVAFGEVDGDPIVVTAGEDGAIRLWDASSGERREQFDGHEGAVRAIAVGDVEGRATIVSTGDDGTVRLWYAGWTPAPDQVEWISDAPAREDLLGRMQLARALGTRLQRMREDDPDTSFLIHIDGAWGSGKSTVLGFLRRQLGDGWLIVTFDAWRQSRVGPPWWALLTRLRQAVAASRTPGRRMALRAEESWQRGRRAGASYVLGLLGLLAAVAAIYLVLRPASGSLNDLGDAARALTAIVAAVATLWAGSRVVSRFLLWDSAIGARLYEQSQDNPMEGVADHFAWLVTKADARVVFFIDDLDRCEPAYVVDLLDSVQTLIRDSPRRLGAAAGADRAPYFVVAADGAWVRQSYEVAYESFRGAIGDPGRPLGYLFLDKIFQLTVQVPAISPGQQERYLNTLLLPGRREAAPSHDEAAAERAATERRIEKSESEGEVLSALRAASPQTRAEVAPAAVAKLSERQVQAGTEHALEKFAALLEPNPRAMKRFLNTYSLARAAAVLEDRLVAREPLALWTILRERWPVLADHLRAHPEQIEALVEARAPGPGTSPDLAELYGAPEVRGVLGFEDGVLTAGAIRDLAGTGRPGSP